MHGEGVGVDERKPGVGEGIGSHREDIRASHRTAWGRGEGRESERKGERERRDRREEGTGVRNRAAPTVCASPLDCGLRDVVWVSILSSKACTIFYISNNGHTYLIISNRS